MPPPSKVKTHDRRPRLAQEFVERFSNLRSMNFNAQNTVQTEAIQNKTKIHYRGARKREKEKKNRKKKMAPVGPRRSQARKVAGLHSALMYL